ncbi:MAG: hypothetical protein OXH78_12515 [Acidimicrobiaceae bacterium]|nr:hypothetical protein [Acidimicrobiaceae bacterium]
MPREIVEWYLQPFESDPARCQIHFDDPLDDRARIAPVTLESTLDQALAVFDDTGFHDGLCAGQRV